MNKNNELILDLPSSIKRFAVDYLQISNSLRDGPGFDEIIEQVIYFIDPVDEDDVFSEVGSPNPLSEIHQLNDVESFAFFDGSVPLDDSRHSEISGYNYDLIIMTPFTHSESNFSLSHMVDSAKISGLKKKSNSKSPGCFLPTSMSLVFGMVVCFGVVIGQIIQPFVLHGWTVQF